MHEKPKITGAWRVDFFATKKAAQAFADLKATRNTPITRDACGWRLCWLPPHTRHS